MLKSCSNIYLNKAVKCVVIIALITSSFTAVGCSKQNLDKNKAEDATKQGEATLVSNLKMSLKVIKAAQDKNQWSISMLDDLCKRLTAIEARSTVDAGIFKDKDGKIKADFYTVITDTDSTVSTLKFLESSKDYQKLVDRRIDAVNELTKIKARFGMTTTVSSDTTTSTDTSGAYDPYAAAKAVEASNPNYMKGVTVHDGGGPRGDVSGIAGSGSSSTGTQASVPAKYAGYKLVSARLATVNSDEQIYVKYGSHTYGCKNQAEYDAVLSKVEEAVKNMPALDQYITRYMNGDRAQKYPEGSDEWQGLTAAYKLDGFLIYKINNNAIATKILQSYGLYGILAKQASAVAGSPNSAYDVLFRHVTDCDAGCHLQSAIHDALGFSSLIVNDSTHADENVCVNGTWWCNTLPANPNGVSHLTEPTF